MTIDIRDYDLALTNRIHDFYCNTHFIMRPNIPIKEIRDRKVLNGCDVEFPLITVRRTSCPIISKEYNSWSRAITGQQYNTAQIQNPAIGFDLNSRDPALARKIINDGHYDNVTVVNSTFDLTYYIDVISFERDNFDTILVELQENLLRVPYLGFPNIRSDGAQDQLIKDQSCHLNLEEVEDTSDLENFDSGNAIYRATLTVKLNAYIYRKYKVKAVEKIALSYNVSDQFNGDNNTDSIISYEG